VRAVSRATSLALLIAAGGCAGAGGDPSGTAGSNGPGTAGNAGPGTAGSSGPGTAGNPGTAGSGTAGSSGGTAGSGNPNFQLECSGPAPGRPFLRLLTGSELLNSLNDVFPEVKGQWTAT
jgi:hypothetical protein